MTRVIWNDTGLRRYRTGIDRGMFYTADGVAVPWQGLVSVTETPVASDPTPVYLDGNKVQNVPGGEDFTATIQAYTAPIEFAPCTGRLQLENGLYATNQPKQTFWFSYRTLSGDDVNGATLDYRVHVICNALAKMADFEHDTGSDSVSPHVHSALITTTPVVISGFRPSAHFVLDTRKVTIDFLNGFEAILYGDDDNNPRMPTLAELTTLLTT